jgi:hypothetical protein
LNRVLSDAHREGRRNAETARAGSKSKSGAKLARNNAALLDSLGLSSIPSIRPRANDLTKPKVGETEARLKRANRGSGQGVKRRKVVLEPTRRSGRVRAMAEDEEEGKKRKYT